MSLLSRFRAILFHMDGLMFNSETLFHWAWQQAAAELGYELDDRLYLELVGRSNATSEVFMLETFGSAFPLEQFRPDWVRCGETLVKEQRGEGTKGCPKAWFDRPAGLPGIAAYSQGGGHLQQPERNRHPA